MRILLSGNGTANGAHLMVVSDNTGNGVLTASSIKIIESTNGRTFGNVCKNRDVSNLESNNKNGIL